MAYDTKNVGVAAVILGVVVFVIATGDLLFRFLGILFSVVAINYGLQCMGQPPLLVFLQNWFDRVKKG